MVPAQPSSLIALAMIAGVVLMRTRWQRPGRWLLISGLAALSCSASPR